MASIWMEIHGNYMHTWHPYGMLIPFAPDSPRRVYVTRLGFVHHPLVEEVDSQIIVASNRLQLTLNIHLEKSHLEDFVPANIDIKKSDILRSPV